VTTLLGYIKNILEKWFATESVCRLPALLKNTLVKNSMNTLSMINDKERLEEAQIIYTIFESTMTFTSSAGDH
jgi:hypothetical protein